MNKMDIVVTIINLIKSCDSECNKLCQSFISRDRVNVDTNLVDRYINGCYKVLKELANNKVLFTPEVYGEMETIIQQNISRLESVVKTIKSAQGSFGSR